MPIPEFEETLKRMQEIHNLKNQDYADKNNAFSNFDVSTYLISLFHNDRDKSFVWPIATKLARLSTLLNSGNTPNNESIADSLVDIANYVILWKCDLSDRKKSQIYFYKGAEIKVNPSPTKKVWDDVKKEKEGKEE